jgi:hypothetical protein
VRRVTSLLLAAACGAQGGAAAGTSEGGESTSAAATSTSSATASSASTSLDGSGDAEASASSAADATTGSGFVLEVHTLLTDDGRLALSCNLPPAVDDCAAIEGAPCDDADGDGLADAWEDAVLERLRPLRRFDEGESFQDDAAAVAADVGRVAAAADGYRVFVMLGYHLDYGSCGVSGHNGDSERVALALEPYPDGDVGGVAVVQAYTAAHENTTNDHSRVFAGADLDLLVFAVDARFGEPRWVVFSSRDKHATYGNLDICETISMVPCLDEDCGADGVDDPAAFDLLPVAVNAGEEAMPRVTDLADVGFPGDDAWAMQDFCGGLGGSGCSAPVRDKLLVDPF